MSEQQPPVGDPSAADAAWDMGADPRPRGRRRRTAILAVTSVAVVAIIGGGALAAVELLGSGGPQPADALPARTVALLTVDLDPSATQKIEALRTMRKFPGLKKQLGEGDDLRRTVFDDATKDGSCKGLSFDRDISPWLGDRAAVGAVDLGARTPAPVLALQVSDAEEAKAGVAKVAACGHPGRDFGYVVANGYLLISDSSEHATTIAAAAKSAPLSQDASYRKWSAAAGGAGIVDFYVGKRAGQLLADNPDLLAASGFPGLRSGTSMASLPSASASPAAYHPATGGADPLAAMKKSLARFQGMAGAVRFADGGVELEIASGSPAAQPTVGGPVGQAVGRLPKDTAVALGFGTSKDYAKRFSSALSSAMGGMSGRLLGSAERQLGITLPGDLQTLLGKAMTLSLGGNAPAELSSVAGPADLPLALSVTGDPAAIGAVIAKVEKHTGHSLAEAQLVTRTGGDTFTVATNSGYADQLQKQGGLGDSDTFRGAVPNADKASVIVYVDFDSAWVPAVARTFGFGGSRSGSVGANLAPLKALGISSWNDGHVGHVLVKVTTD